jgi:hypothetical protein
LQPCDYIIESGPPVGEVRPIKLQVAAEGWPEPTFQWYCDGAVLPGENHSDLQLYLKCPANENTRSYRCVKCKMVSLNLSSNVYSIVCGNCKAPYKFHEVINCLLY